MPGETEDLDYLNTLADAEEEAPEETTTAKPAEDKPADEPEVEADEEEAEAADEAEEGKAAAPEQEVQDQPHRKQTASDRVRASREQVRTEREARIRAEAERDALLKFRPSTPAPDNSEAIRKREEKLALLEPQERAIFLQSERIEQMNHQLMISELRSEDRADKAAYEAKALVDPRYARNKTAVEDKLRDFRAKGINATREQCLVQVIGEKMLNEKPRKGEREAAGRRVDSVKGKPPTAKGMAPAAVGKGDDLASLEARLSGKPFSEMFGN